MSTSTVRPAVEAPTTGRTIARWAVSFVGFPLGGLAAMTLVGPVDSPASARATSWRSRGLTAVVAARVRYVVSRLSRAAATSIWTDPLVGAAASTSASARGSPPTRRRTRVSSSVLMGGRCGRPLTAR